MIKKSKAHYVRKERKTPENVSGKRRGYEEIQGVVVGWSLSDSKKLCRTETDKSKAAGITLTNEYLTDFKY